MRVRVDGTASVPAAASRIGVAVAAVLPALVIRLTGRQLAPVPAMLIFGTAVLASVALLLWAAEAARVDLAGGLTLSLLALVTVLPEYAIDIYYAFAAGSDPAYAPYTTANMTGANRLLIGLAWPVLVFSAIWAVRRRGRPGDPDRVRLRPHRRIEIAFLAGATLYAWVIPLVGRLAWYDSLLLGGLFLGYLWRVSHAEHAEEELVGVAATLAIQPARRRRPMVAGLFAAAALTILLAAQPFGESLIDAGAALGISEFLLVQWLAPIASEAPEVIVAVAFALRGRADDGLGALLAAKLNQWTLLIACLPVAYHLGGGGLAGIPLDARQTEELLLTAAQTLLGLAILVNLCVTRGEALVLLVLFVVQLALPEPGARYLITGVYLLLAVWLLVRRRRQLPALAVALRR